MTVDQDVTHGEVLCHTDDGVIYGSIAVGVVFTDDVADNTRRFFVGGIPVVFQFVHGIQHAAVYRFETVAHVRQRAPDNDAHGVVEIAFAHFVFKAYRQSFEGEFVVVADGYVGHGFNISCWQK